MARRSWGHTALMPLNSQRLRGYTHSMHQLCLSFDNGPEPATTPQVLAVLARRGIRSSFFPIGAKLRDPARRALAERALAEGHRIGNHTLHHGTPLGRRPTEEAVAEITGAEALLGPLNHERLFRPNGGGGQIGPHLLNHAALAHLIAGAYSVVLWNAVPRDWDDADGWPARALAAARQAEAPVLMVLHDLLPAAMAHLDRVLGTLADEGATFTHELPAACLPLVAGRPAPGFDLTTICQEEIAK